MITFSHKGDFSKTLKYLNKAKDSLGKFDVDKYGKMGVEALSVATPQASGKTAMSWDYVVTRTNRSVKITWVNSNVVNHTPVAILIQYGHASKNGAYVQGRDFINPAMKATFDIMAEQAWKEVSEV